MGTHNPGTDDPTLRSHLNIGKRISLLVKGAIYVTALTTIAIPVWPQQNTYDLTDQPLEDLMNMQVTSVSKKEQKLSRTASAIHLEFEDTSRSAQSSLIKRSVYAKFTGQF